MERDSLIKPKMLLGLCCCVCSAFLCGCNVQNSPADSAVTSTVAPPSTVSQAQSSVASQLENVKRESDAIQKEIEEAGSVLNAYTKKSNHAPLAFDEHVYTQEQGQLWEISGGASPLDYTALQTFYPTLAWPETVGDLVFVQANVTAADNVSIQSVSTTGEPKHALDTVFKVIPNVEKIEIVSAKYKQKDSATQATLICDRTGNPMRQWLMETSKETLEDRYRLLQDQNDSVVLAWTQGDMTFYLMMEEESALRTAAANDIAKQFETISFS